MENMFFIRFIMSSVSISVLTLLLLSVKWLFQKHIAMRWQYYMWIIFFVILTVPFIPRAISNEQFKMWNHQVSMLEKAEESSLTIDKLTARIENKESNIGEFGIEAEKSKLFYMNRAGGVIWLIGVLVYSIRFLGSKKILKKMLRDTKAVENEEIQAIFEGYKTELHIRQSIILRQSKRIKGPIACGIRKTYIVLPTESIECLEIESIRYIILHELMHYKNKDILMNYLMSFFKGIYWFNPLIHYAFQLMIHDREKVCDGCVLKRLDTVNYKAYGKTILYFIEQAERRRGTGLTAHIGGSRKEVKERIEHIALFRKEARGIRAKSIIIFTLIACLVRSQLPGMTIMAYENPNYTFQEESVIYEDLSDYFHDVKGSFVLYDMQKDGYTIYNRAKSVRRVSPNSTYKIYSGLMALEAGVISEGNLYRQWDGSVHAYDEWNKNQDLYSAMEHSANWYFQELDKSVGKEKIQYYLEEMAYGNSNISGGIDSHWMESSLRISPVEQVMLLRDLYKEELVFCSEHMELVKDTLKMSEKNGVTLSGKTGSGIIDGEAISGWFIGYVEQEENTFIFATNIEGNDTASGKKAVEITRAILQDKGIY